MSFDRSLVTENCFEITPDDGGNIRAFGLYVGITGDVKVTSQDGGVATFQAVPAGSIIPLSVTKVWDTGTTADGIVGFG